MTLILSEQDVRACVRMEDVIASIEEALAYEAAGRAEVAPRVTIPAPGNGFLRLMGATIEGQQVVGFKAFNAGGHNGVRYTIGLHDTESGDQLALMDGAYLTAVRTGAVTGIATRLGAAGEPASVAVIGSGLEARTNLEGVAATLPLTEFHVFSPTPASREGFAEEMSAKLGIDGMAHDDPASCTAAADVVVVATSTRGRDTAIAFRPEWLRLGMHVSSIGSTHPRGRELDEAVFPLADRVVMDAPTEASEESGDVIAACAGGLDMSAVVALVDLFGSERTFRRDASEITLFKSVGTGLQDVAAALAVYEAAREQGLGTHVDYLGSKRSPRNVGAPASAATEA